MEKDWLFKSDEFICGLRVAAVLIKNNKILVQKEKNGSEYALPGGHVKIGETSEAGLVREIAEEIGLKVEYKRLLWSEECFWKWNGKRAHHIVFYYLIELCEDSEIPKDEFVPQKDNCNVLIGWMPIDEIQNNIIYPEFLKKEVFRLDEPLKHFISES